MCAAQQQLRWWPQWTRRVAMEGSGREGVILRGGDAEPISKDPKDDRQPHLSQQNMRELIKNVLGAYPTHSPFEAAVSAADLVAGVLVGVADKTIQWLQALVALPGPRRIGLVVVVFPARPTREEHLISLKLLQAQDTGPEQELKVRLLPVARAFGPDYETMILPPTVLQAQESSTGRTTYALRELTG